MPRPFRFSFSILRPLCGVLAVALTCGFFQAPQALAGAEPELNAGAMQILKSNCFSCHNDKKKKGGLIMTSREALLEGGDSGEALIPGKAGESLLIESLAPKADPHMPPKKQLSDDQIAQLSRWVEAGAEWDAAALAVPDPPRPVKLAPLPVSYRPVLALALSPDGAQLAVGCGNELVLYAVEAKTLTLIARASAHPDPVQAIAWSPDGARLATGAFRRAVLWNAGALSIEREITAGLTDRISAVRFSPDGALLILADGRTAEDGVVHIADATCDAVRASWSAHSDTIFDLAVSADGRRLATAGGDKLVKIWDISSQQEVARLEAHTTQVLALAFDTDAGRLVTGGADQQLKVWDVQSKQLIMTLGNHAKPISGVAWVREGPTIFAVTDAGGLLRYTDFKAHTGAQSSDSASERKLEAADTPLNCIAASAGADRIFAGAQDGRVLFWNKDGKLLLKQDVSESRVTAAVTAR